MLRTWDIFCSVVDNFGDIGTCWRLARQLSGELDQRVRLWVDDLASFRRLCHGVDATRTSQSMEGIEIRHWSRPFPQVDVPDIVIEGFGARLPDPYIEAMAARRPHPVWINLEYLSAEGWVETCHRLPSPHPRFPLTKYFYFPGFSAATGGLLMERDLAAIRDAFQNDAEAQAAFWRPLVPALLDERALRLSLFCYENAALPALVEVWSMATEPVACIVPASSALTQLARIANRPLGVGDTFKSGALTVYAIPFLELDHYDRLLWACDFNFVRGEDSFVRAQLAARPFAWQAYPQEAAAHLPKVSAFLDRYTGSLPAATGGVIRAAFEAWNQETTMGEHWSALRQQWQPLNAHAQGWARRLLNSGNLAIHLAEFCENQLK